MRMAIQVAQYHHEKVGRLWLPESEWQGKISHWLDRIAAVADVFDALTAERPYKKAWSVEDALSL